MTAYLSPNPKDGKKHPAIVWTTGGDCNSIDERAALDSRFRLLRNSHHDIVARRLATVPTAAVVGTIHANAIK